MTNNLAKQGENSINVYVQDIEEAYNISGKNEKDLQLANQLSKQSIIVNPTDITNQEHYDNTMTAIKDINPQDKIEAMLATQMVTVHNVAMQALARASNLLQSKNIPTAALGTKAFNVASTLTRTYTMQMEALNKHRGKGQQKITVEHINIAEGGKAVIGNIANTNKLESQKS